jgi:hypothetical protein
VSLYKLLAAGEVEDAAEPNRLADAGCRVSF